MNAYTNIKNYPAFKQYYIMSMAKKKINVMEFKFMRSTLVGINFNLNNFYIFTKNTIR